MLSSGLYDVDNKKENVTTLFIIDPQIDFHTGSLTVAGAEDDARRIAATIEGNLDNIDNIIISMDSHHRNHIAHAVFWKQGELFKIEDFKDTSPFLAPKKKKRDQNIYEPAAFSTISRQDLDNKIWTPVDQSLVEWCRDYTSRLEASSFRKERFKLTIWPEHCLVGTRGHAVYPDIHNAAQTWAKHSMKTIHYIYKGSNCLTEMYSAIKAEVEIETDPSTQENRTLLKMLRESASNNGKLIVCGQALSHCVNYTVLDIVEDWQRHPDASRRLRNICLLTDGASPVTGFKKQADDFLDDMRAKGVTLIPCEDVPKVLAETLL